MASQINSLLTKDSAKEWNKPDVIKWKDSARRTLQSHYCTRALEKKVWNEYSLPDGQDLLLSQICLELFGRPRIDNWSTGLRGLAIQNDDSDDDECSELVKPYKKEQRKEAKEILAKILEVRFWILFY